MSEKEKVAFLFRGLAKEVTTAINPLFSNGPENSAALLHLIHSHYAGASKARQTSINSSYEAVASTSHSNKNRNSDRNSAGKFTMTNSSTTKTVAGTSNHPYQRTSVPAFNHRTHAEDGRQICFNCSGVGHIGKHCYQPDKRIKFSAPNSSTNEDKRNSRNADNTTPQENMTISQRS